MEIGEKLRRARESSGMTQESAAEQIMVSRQTISNWENGKSLPDINSVVKMSELYGMSLDDLIKGDVQMMKKIEDDEKKLEGNNRALRVMLILFLSAGALYFISLAVGGAFYDFCSSALPYIMLGLVLLCAVILQSTGVKKKT